MGLSRLVQRAAQLADVRVFCIGGSGARDEVRELRLREGLRLSPGPRGANVLLVAGELDAGLVAPALVAHDALAAPRATVWWPLGARGSLVRASFPDALVIDGRDPVPALTRIHRELLDGRRRSEPPLLPDVEPAPWRGLGPYGQGGKAMTGGVPYGRPLPERADDRDGLKLDQLPVRVGPLFAPFPTGLCLDVKLQGDVIQEVTPDDLTDAASPNSSIFHDALLHPVSVRELELARARSHLHWLSDAVAVGGPASLSERILRLAPRLAPGDGDAVRAVERTLRRRGFLSWATKGVGVLARDDLDGVTGPAARASGSETDSRAADDAYARLDFEPVTQERGDAAARWLQRLREAAQSLDMAARAGDATIGGAQRIESPRGLLTPERSPCVALAALAPSLVIGMEWGDAVTTIVSLDLDMSAARAPAIVGVS